MRNIGGTSLGRIIPVTWLLALLTVGCELPGKPDPADRPVPADQVLAFATLYRQNCSGCHGPDGKLGPGPPLNDTLFRGIVSEDELESVITRGRKKTLMPAFARDNGGTLTALQIQVLVKEIKGIPYVVKKKDGDAEKVAVVADGGGISPQWGVPSKLPKGVPSYREQSAKSNGNSAANKDKGTQVFARACASCHGNHGQGIEKKGETVHTINDPVFLALNSDQVLRRYAITGRPDLGMPGYADARPDDTHFVPLTDQEITDLVALLASWRGEPR